MFMGHARAQDMIESVCEGMGDLGFRGLYRLSMDGPNVNWAFDEKLSNIIYRG